jgi:hypothetical protein
MGLLKQHAIVHRRHVDSMCPQSTDHWIHLAGEQNKLPEIAAFPGPVGWKLMAVATPSAGGIFIAPSVIFSMGENGEL